MKTVEETRRELFEVWAAKHNESIKDYGIDTPEDIRLDRQGGVYIWANAESAWFAFNAALDSVVIELPPRREFTQPKGDNQYWEDAGFNHARALIRASVESTGLGIKVVP